MSDSLKTVAYVTFNSHKIAEERIQEALRRGDFENLEGRGKPIIYDDDSMVPEELRMAYKILKNADCLPPELAEEKEISNAIELLSGMQDEEERYRQIQKLNLMITKMNSRRKRPIHLEKKQIYYERIVERVCVNKKNK